MPIVEGVGDEVIQVLGICLIILIIVTAWKSTAIRELPQIRAVFIVDRRSHSIISNDVSALQSLANPPDPGPVTNNENTNNTVPVNTASGNKPTPAGSNNEINAYRLSYFSNLQNQNPSTSTSNESGGNIDSATNDQESKSDDKIENLENTDNPDSAESENAIRVKLKYLNDEQRVVTADLKELLGQFKRRYFQVELSQNKNVLLIFQGRVLREEEKLEAIGMYDNCVVHCLIKAGRPPSETNDNIQSSNNTNSNIQPADWNLGPVLLATLVAIFSLAWFSYWTYPQLFGITSTVLLATLTTLFILAVASLYYPNLFQSV